MIENYQQCSTSPETAFVNTVGITLGNMGAIIPILAILTIGILQLYQWLSGHRVFAGYSVDEKSDALDALATSLLFAKDQVIASQQQEIGMDNTISDKNSSKEAPDSLQHTQLCDALLHTLWKEIQLNEHLYSQPEKLYAEIQALRQKQQEGVGLNNAKQTKSTSSHAMSDDIELASVKNNPMHTLEEEVSGTLKTNEERKLND